jgi:hypothetical protein
LHPVRLINTPLGEKLMKAGLAGGGSTAGGLSSRGDIGGGGPPQQAGVGRMPTAAAPSNPVVSDMTARRSQALLIPTNDVDPTTSLAWSASPLEPAYQRALNMHPLNAVAQSFISPSPSGNLGVGDGGAGGRLGPASSVAIGTDLRDYGRQSSTPPGTPLAKAMSKATRDLTKVVAACSKKRRA